MIVGDTEEKKRIQRRRRRVERIVKILRPFMRAYYSVKRAMANNPRVIGIAGVFLVACVSAFFISKAFAAASEVDKYTELTEEVATVSQSAMVLITDSDDADTENQDADAEIPWYAMIDVDFARLTEINSDIKGWIFFENEDISYPLLYSGDNEKYLRTGYDGEALERGSIFIDGRNNSDMEAPHTIIYGHNMRDGQMFGRLKLYERETDYYPEHKYFQILMPDAKYRYEIFAYGRENETSDIYRVDFGGQSEVDAFISDLVKDSVDAGDVQISRGDKIITLSTCTADDESRLVVHAVRVDFYR